MTTTRAAFQSHFTRVWANRHNTTVVTFADGRVHDCAARRASVRDNVSAQRWLKGAA